MCLPLKPNLASSIWRSFWSLTWSESLHLDLGAEVNWKDVTVLISDHHIPWGRLLANCISGLHVISAWSKSSSVGFCSCAKSLMFKYLRIVACSFADGLCDRNRQWILLRPEPGCWFGHSITWRMSLTITTPLEVYLVFWLFIVHQ